MKEVLFMDTSGEKSAVPSEKLSVPVYYFGKGTNYNAYDFLGCHRKGNSYSFTLWAPAAEEVSLVGSFNDWTPGLLKLKRAEGGFWQITTAEVKEMDMYKYAVVQKDGKCVLKCDPFAFHSETRPSNASKIISLSGFKWTDAAWMHWRKDQNPHSSAINIYELHAGSWKTYENGLPFSYAKLSEELIPYVKSMGYTHIELMPVSEYPLDDSWGYQVIGYYAPTSRYGTPLDFMSFINDCHRSGLGVIIDWVGAHFPKDECGLYEFDGTHLFEYADSEKSEHPEWTTRVFDFGKNEVRSFLISNILFWIKKYHVDGIRVDAVTSMIYLDYGREPGSWTPNKFGGNENLEAVDLLRSLNEAAKLSDPSVIMFAEESSPRKGVTAPIEKGGLGFDFKWNMGWMHDTLDYFSIDPYYRSQKHDLITFAVSYAFAEAYTLPLSHDEVVHGKFSLINRMPGTYEQKFANLRVLFGYMMVYPGKKLSFMGNEYAQFIEWDYKKGLDFFLLDYPAHRAFQTYIRDLNFFYLDRHELWEDESGWSCFKWIACDDTYNNVVALRRIAPDGSELAAVLNFCPVLHENYEIGVPISAEYIEVFSSDSSEYSGSGISNPPRESKPVPMHSLPYRISLTLPPLSVIFLEPKLPEKLPSNIISISI